MEQVKRIMINTPPTPFIEAIEKVVEYTKFLKDLIVNQKELEKVSEVVLNE